MRRAFLAFVALLLLWPFFASTAGAPPESVHTGSSRREVGAEGLITLSLRDVPIAEAVEMLAKKGRRNILLDREVEGRVSLNLYEVSLDEAIAAVAESAGCVVKRRPLGCLIIPGEKAGEGGEVPSETEVRSLKVEYSEAEPVVKILKRYLSEHGAIRAFEERKLLVVEDYPANLERIEKILREIDRAPRQVIIEAKILEIALDESETFGLDWTRLFTAGGGEGSIGVQGFANADASGLVASLQDSSHIDFVLNLLNQKGRVHTLSTPKLRALENEEASVIIGDRQGFVVTTTINQVTTESIEFLESGVILKVIPSVDRQGRILMYIHPEVSTGDILEGVPSQTTTEVSTSLLAEDGQTIFIGGLIKNKTALARSGIPVLGDVPLIGRLFSSSENVDAYSETVVLITPRLVEESIDSVSHREEGSLEAAESEIDRRLRSLHRWVSISGGEGEGK